MSAGRTVQPLIVIPDEGCGPAMLALNPAQRAFVYARVHFGCNNAEAARRAGYSDSAGGGAKVTAYRLAHSEAIIAATVEENRKVLVGEGARSILTLRQIRDNKKEEAKDRIKAAVELLNRGGLNAVSEAHLTVDHNHHMTEAQQDARILALAREAGLSDAEARKLLIDPSKVIDAEFEEVPAEKTPEQTARAERYERENERRKELDAMTPEQREASKAETRERRREEAKAKYDLAQVPEELRDLF